MSFPIEINTTALVRVSNEPVFVTRIEDDKIFVKRAVTSTEGLNYIQDVFAPAELISEKDSLKRELDFTKFSLSMREAYSAEYEAAQKAIRDKEKMAVPTASIPDGSGYSN